MLLIFFACICIQKKCKTIIFATLKKNYWNQNIYIYLKNNENERREKNPYHIEY